MKGNRRIYILQKITTEMDLDHRRKKYIRNFPFQEAKKNLQHCPMSIAPIGQNIEY